jgi:hypothetical protein
MAASTCSDALRQERIFPCASPLSAWFQHRRFTDIFQSFILQCRKRSEIMANLPQGSQP